MLLQVSVILVQLGLPSDCGGERRRGGRGEEGNGGKMGREREICEV